MKYEMKRKEKEQFKNLGFSFKEHAKDDSTILTCDFVQRT